MGQTCLCIQERAAYPLVCQRMNTSMSIIRPPAGDTKLKSSRNMSGKGKSKWLREISLPRSQAKTDKYMTAIKQMNDKKMPRKTGK